MTEKKEIPRDAYIAIEKEKINKMNKKEKDKMIQNAKQICCESNVNESTDVTNNDALPKELVSILPISQPTHNIRSSQETLYEVKKRLRSLHNVLRTYQDMSRISERQESIDKINEIDALTSIEKIDKNKIDVNCNNNSKENLQQINCSVVNSCKYFKCNCSEESSTLVEYSSNISKDVTLQNEDVIKTTLFNSTKKIPEIESREMYYVSSSESFEDLNIQIQNETPSIANFIITKNCSDILDEKHWQENMIISQNSSQNKISNDSNREEKSTALLLQEALHFKKALLTRIQSRRECPIDSIKEDIGKEFLPELNNNNFPSIIIDIEIKESITSNSHNKINQCFIYLEMKQRYDLFPEYLQKANAFAHRKSKRDIENQNRVSEKSSQYFSISNLTIPNNNVGSDVSLKSPAYEKVLSIVIPVSIEDQSEIDINEKLMQTKTVLGNIIQARVNPRENFKENTYNIGDKADKHSLTILKFEDLILEHIKSIRDYMDNFLRNQNKAISKARKALQCQNNRYLNETNHIVLYNRLTASSNCNSTDQVIDSTLNNSSNLLINTGLNYKQISMKDNILKCYSDMCLRKNPEILIPTTPIKFSNKNNTQHSMAIELKRRETDLFHPITLKYYCKNHSKSTHNCDLDIPFCEKYTVIDMKNDKKINKKRIINSANLQKPKKQTQIVKNKSSVILYVPFATTDAKIVETLQ